MRLLAVLFLTACPAQDKPTTHDTADSDGDTDLTETGDPLSLFYDIHAAPLAAALGWVAGLAPFAGYSGAGAPGGFYLADPYGDGEHAFIYRVPWTTTGSLIEDAADLVLTTGYLGPDKIGYEDGRLCIPDADATTTVEHAGIGYSLAEPTESGELADAGGLAIEGDVATGYASRIIWLDVDGDGDADDVAATQSTPDDPVYHGQIGIFLDAPMSGTLTFAAADYTLDACEDTDTSRIAYGPVDLAVDVDGLLWATCPASNYHSGTAESWTLPLYASATPSVTIDDVGGWTMDSDPRGGVWLGGQGNGTLTRADQTGVLAVYDSSGDDYFGAAPVTLATSTGQVLLAVGIQTRTTDEASGVVLCDITTTDLTDCEVYHPTEAVPCVGEINALVEVDGTIYLGSSGWLYGSGAGCGAQIWTLSAE